MMSMTLQDCLAWEMADCTSYCGDSLAVLRCVPTDAWDMIFTSPPYMDARTYGIDGQRDCEEWIEWMLPRISEMVRVTRGPVFINCAGVTRDWQYWPGCEGLSYRAYQVGIRQRRPAYWHRVGIPGSGGSDYLRADIEYVLCFTKCEGAFPWSDNTANGHAPKWAPGGEMSNRTNSGARVNQWGHSLASGGTHGALDGVTSGKARPSHTLASADNPTSKGKASSRRLVCTRPRDGMHTQNTPYKEPAKANPGTLVSGIPVGGGMLGHRLAHENEAPFPVKLAEWFIRSWCPPGGIVGDPFGGSGTVGQAARQLGRRAALIDIRANQCDLMRRRLAQQELFAAGATR